MLNTLWPSLSHHQIVTLVTLLRIVLLPFIAFFFLMDFTLTAWLGLVLFIVAALSDWADGYLARRWGCQSAIGDLLDTVSDKIFVSCMLALSIAVGSLYGPWLLCVFIIITREFVIGAVREYLRAKDIPLPHSLMGRWKTVLQMSALAFLLIGPYGDALVPGALWIGQGLLLAATAMTVASGYQYWRTAWPHLSDALWGGKTHDAA